jgi:hypothetical protein
MSKLSNFLVESIIGKPIITFGGGFKPPTYSHLSVVKKAIEEFPTREKFIIFVGSGERDGITQEQSYEIWNIYKKYLPSDIEIIKAQSPIKEIFNYSKENLDKQIIYIIGGREGNEQDAKDFEGKTKFTSKYPNLTPFHIMTDGGVSGTLARQALNKGREEFFKYLPAELSEEDKNNVFNILYNQNELVEIKDKIPGGLAKGKSLKDLASKHKTSENNVKHQLKKGLKVEMEHTNDKRIALEIAMDHVYEDINYYDKLGIIEESEDDIISMTNAIISYMDESWENYQHIIKAIDALEDKYDIPVQQTAAESVKLMANQIGSSAIEPLYRLTKQTGLLKENLKSFNYNSIVNELNSYALRKNWNIKPLPKLEIIEGDVNNSQDFFGKTAYYEPSTNIIALYTEGRHPKDIMRSYCHELRHHHQNLEGRLQNIHTENINEDDYLKEIEKDAYLEGNLLFREWENSRKSLNEEVKIEKTEDYIEVDIIEDNKTIGNITLESYDGKNYTIIDANIEEAYRGKGLYKKAILNTLNKNPHIKITSAFRSKDAEFAWNSLLKNLPSNIKRNIINRKAENTKEITLSLNENKELNVQDIIYNQEYSLEHGIERELEFLSNIMDENIKDIEKLTNPKIKRVPLYSINPSQFKDDYKNSSSEAEAEEYKNVLKGGYDKDIRLSNYDPILVNRLTNKIIDGNHRHYALSAINSPYAVCLFVDVPREYLNEYVNNAKQILYCDLDGVLGDFDARFQYFAKMKPQAYEKKYGKEAFWDLIDKQVGEIFWTGIEWMPEGEKLWNYIKKYNPIILSAPSRNSVSRMGKKIWVEDKMPGTQLILASRENKMEYSGKNKILIDDRADTISEWISKGGIGILFTSTEQTISDLEKLNLKSSIKEVENILIPRRSPEERRKNWIIALQKKLQKYMKEGGKGDLDLENTPITSLPQGLKVGGYLDLGDTKIKELPQGLKVGGNLFLNNTPIEELPQDLKVGGTLYLGDTPLSKKYTEKEIRRMVPGVKGSIYL